MVAGADNRDFVLLLVDLARCLGRVKTHNSSWVGLRSEANTLRAEWVLRLVVSMPPNGELVVLALL